MPRALYLGYLWRGLRAIHLAEGWELVAVGLEPQRLLTRQAKRYCDENGVPTFDARNLRNNEQLARLLAGDGGIDLIVVGAFGQILPKSIFHAPRYGAINAHPSLLPAYRGGTIIEEQILAGESQGGATIHWIADDVDCGDIIVQTPFLIDPEHDDYQTIFDKFHEAFELELKSLLQLTPNRWQRHLQSPGGDTYQLRKREDAAVDFSLSAQTLSRRIRAFGWRGWCSVKVGDKIVEVAKAKEVPFGGCADPGYVLCAEDGIVVATGRNAILFPDWPSDIILKTGMQISGAF
ncbi:putative Methionyl-tRNA formyltransferase [Rhodospirillaceae bacterium LM-1]|nr:putative Methionyl-tRNA formyltransferase [Rhodospirillaceae bacterium LM-1]